MENNRSLAVSTLLSQGLKKEVMLGVLGEHIPDDIFKSDTVVQGRDRVFTHRNTLETMLLSATLEDKSLKNAVNQFYIVHQKKREILGQTIQQETEEQKEAFKNKTGLRGRPRKFDVSLPKSKAADISLNTAAYSNARKRLPVEFTKSLFESSKIKDFKNDYSHWHGLTVALSDGTYLQLQDTVEIQKMFPIEKNPGSYPQALLEAIIVRGTGQLFNYKLASRTVSELALFNEMLDDVPQGYIMLMDDLYNSYEIMNKCFLRNIHFVVPAKRKRNFKVIRSNAKGDDIIEIKRPDSRSKWAAANEPLLPKLTLRKIDCVSPDGKEYVLFTSVVDPKTDKTEIQMLYLTRWDIEISIREVKTIMDINVLRSKTPQMLEKELNVSLSAYNIIRNIIYASLKDLPFPPKEDFIYEFYTLNKDILIDKKGRIYSKWSTGRKRNKTTHPQANIA